MLMTQPLRLRYAYLFAHRQSNPGHPHLLELYYYTRGMGKSKHLSTIFQKIAYFFFASLRMDV